MIEVLDSPSPNGKWVGHLRFAIRVPVLEEHKDASGNIDYVKIDYGNEWVPPGWVPYSIIEKK